MASRSQKISNRTLLLVIVFVGVVLFSADLLNSNPSPYEGVDTGDDVIVGGGGGSSDSGSSDPQSSSVSAFEGEYYSVFLSNFFVQGRIISQVDGSCSNDGQIACGQDTSSEGIAQTAHIAAVLEDKPVFDSMVAYVVGCMQHPNANYLMWSRDEDCGPGGSGGSNSANDADLIMIDAIRVARSNGWLASDGVSLISLQRELMDALKPAVVNGFLTHCTTYYGDRPVGSRSSFCEERGFVGYVDLSVIEYMSSLDPFWSSVYEVNKAVHIRSVSDGGVFDTYYPSSDLFASERDSIERVWVVRNLLKDGSADSVSAANMVYLLARDDFLSRRALGRSEICKGLRVGVGCEFKIPEQAVYGLWLQAASAAVANGGSSKDVAFRDELIGVLRNKVRYAGPQPMLIDGWQYSNTVVLRAFQDARLSGADVGGLIA